MEYRELCDIEDQFAADLIRQALDEECIQFKIHVNSQSTMESVFHMTTRYGVVLVPDIFRDAALEVIDNVLKARPVSDENNGQDGGQDGEGPGG